MAKNTNAAAPPNVSGGFLKSAFSKFTWYEWLAIPVIAVGGVIFLYREAIASAYIGAQDTIFVWLGVGVIPLSLWAAALLGVLVFRRSLFRHYRLWLATIPLMALTFAVLSLFQPTSGILTPFTLQGYVSLGGMVGEFLASTTTWQAYLRIAVLAVITVAVASSTFLLFALLNIQKVFLFLIIGFVIIGKAIGGMFKAKQYPPIEFDDEEEAIPPSEFARHTAIDDMDESAISSSPFAADAMPDAPEIEDTYAPSANGTINADDDDGADDDAPDSDFAYNGFYAGDIPTDDAPQASEPPYQDAPDEDFEDEYDADSPIDEGLTQMNASYDDGGDALDEEDLRVIDTNASTLPSHTPAVQQVDSRLSGLNIPMLGRRHEKWDTPPIEMLDGVEDRGIPKDQIHETAETIRQTLADYNIEVEIGSIKYGPTVTMYGIIPGWIRKYRQVKLEDELGNPILDDKGKQVVQRQEQRTRVKVDAILSREKDLSLALRTPNLRLETPVMGKAQVGIEIPNREPAPVTLRSIMESAEYKDLLGKSDLPVALGKGTGGENIALDLAKMPHLLIAGATGSGKSVALNAIVSGLLMERSPAELRMILVDPKRVELTPYNGIPHLLCPVIVEVDEVVGVLKGVINEMMNRYRQMEEIGARNIEAYNTRTPESPMPFLIVVVDELADLMMTAAFDVEQSICRLAQLGRATGIHLILATQRPSVDVVTGLIKANFPSRVSFGVTSHTDSRTILDTNGAEKLLGKGDMLYLPRDSARPLRAQGAFISDDEIDRLIQFWQSTPRRWMPEVNLQAIPEEGEADDEGTNSSTDPLFDKAVELAYSQNKLSTSLLQRRLRIGYPRAARLMDELEDNGIVGAGDGSKSRDVIISQV